MDDVVKRFGGVTAVGGVSLELPHENMVALIGPNGSGKSTLFHVIAGLHRPTSGTVSFNGDTISGQPTHKIARMGIVRTFQHRTVFEGLTTRENVESAIAIARSDQDAGALLEFVGLTGFANVTARNLPYGHARNLSVAMALATSPRVVLLDEPAAGLERSESDRLARLLKRLHDEHQIICWVIDHDMKFLMSFVDHVFVMDQGRLIAQGTPAEIRSSALVRERYLGS
jgi:branched-chain amino acid transport system ATP-binding protein